jgi:hypothetical protein
MSRVDREINLETLMRELAATAYDPLPDAVEARLRAACRHRRLGGALRMGVLGVAAALLLMLGWIIRSTSRAG